MDFFEKVGETLSVKGKEAVKKAKEMADISNLSVQISSQEKIINKLYAELGKAYFELHREEEDGPYASQFREIKSASEKIQELKGEINKIKGVKTCENCGADMDADAAYCPGCGTKASAEEPAREPEVDEDLDDVFDDVYETPSETLPDNTSEEE